MQSVLAVEVWDRVSPWVPLVITLGFLVVLVWIVRWLVKRTRPNDPSDNTFRVQVATAATTLVGIVAIIFALPDGSDSDLALSVVGLVVTGALAISSQSIIANAMAGLMLRSVGSFKPGDFIEVAGHLGRVSELDLFHTEIQSTDRDLITLPNSLMVNEPVRVVRSSGTIVSATASIGYDVSRHQLEELFVEAALTSGLLEPFVQVLELGDYSISYRIAGFLEDPRSLMTARSKLRGAIIDTLTDAGVEIMSPMYVTRRAVDNDPLLPHHVTPPAMPEMRRTAEDRVFDKAEAAARIEATKTELSAAHERLSELQDELSSANDNGPLVQAAVARQEQLIERLERRHVRLQDQLTDD